MSKTYIKYGFIILNVNTRKYLMHKQYDKKSERMAKTTQSNPNNKLQYVYVKHP